MMKDNPITDDHAAENGATARRVFDDYKDDIQADAMRQGGPFAPPDTEANVAGYTMFDKPESDDNLLWVLVPKDRIERLPNQASVRIESRTDKRNYLGTVVRGPYTIPDGLRADAVPVVATALRGGFFLPEHHGLVAVEIAGEEKNGATHPHRFRPLPNSRVIPLDTDEIRDFWKTGGNIRLGLAFGHDNLEVSFDLGRKDVLPRHLAILGTTGGGKSTTVAGQIHRLQQAGAAVILLDTEGEYTHINEPTDDARMLAALDAAGLPAEGVENTQVLHLFGRETSNPLHPEIHSFSPQFARISPHAVAELLDLSDAQDERYQTAVGIAAKLLNDLGLWTESDKTKVLTDRDEFDEGYPKMTLSHVYDVIRSVGDLLQHKEIRPEAFRSRDFEGRRDEVKRIIQGESTNERTPVSWRALQGRVGRIERLGLFDNRQAEPLDAVAMLEPGRVTIIDLSDSDSTLVNNLVISELLREVQRAQDDAYQKAVIMNDAPTPVLVMIEEAHEFLSAERLSKMPILHQQVSRIAKRGRKRWLALCFITQLPQHLPDAILGLVNNFILHKIADQSVVTRLKRTIGGVDEALWNRLPRLAQGQAIVSLTSLSRPILTAVDPAPCKLGMTR